MAVAQKNSNADDKEPATASKPVPDFNKEQDLSAYRTMLTIRRFEEKAGQMYGMGLIGGFCHLYIGQEAVVVGMQMALKDGGAPPQMAAQGAAPPPRAAANPTAASNALDPPDALGVPDSPGTSTAMAPSAAQPPLPARRCPHMFAEGAILAGGAIMSCQAYFAEAVGDMNTVPDYMSVWSGPRMQSLRSGLASGSAWVQCNECWISQMHCYAPAAGALESTLNSEAQLTELVMKAWALRHCDRR
jgi:hypothetical protein